MRLNGLGAPDDVTLVPLNHIETTSASTTEDEPKRGFCFYCNKYGLYKAHCRKLERDKWQETRRQNGQINTNRPLKPKCETCGNAIKQGIAGMVPMPPTIRVPNDSTLHPKKLTKSQASLQTKRQKNSICPDYDSVTK